MRDPTQDAKQISSASPSPSPSPRPYPVSTRSYKKKDYDYLSSFPRMAHSVLRATHSDAELLQERTDCNSDLSLTASLGGYATSISSASSTSSSAQSYAKNVIASMDAEGHHHQHHHQQQQHQHHFLNTQTYSHSPRISVDCTESGSIDMKLNDTIDDRSSADVKDDKLNITGDSPDRIDEKASAQVKEPVRSHSKPKPRPCNTPAVLPKFGSWDTRNPSSGEAYTLIFRRLRDEKKSGGIPVCTSPTHSKEEGTEQFLSEESKAKEPLHSNPRVRKDSSRRKAKGKSHQEAAYNQKHATRWNFCCKASVLDD